jgi:uncharacterized membrane protein
MKHFGILRNDNPLAGSDPATRILRLSIGICLIGLLHIGLGIAALYFSWEYLITLDFDIISFVIGFIFLVLGFFTQRRSLIALIIALIIYCLEIVLVLFIVFILVLSFIITLPHFSVSNIVALVLTGDNLSMAILILSFAVYIILSRGILITMRRGVGAIKELKKETPPTRQN